MLRARALRVAFEGVVALDIDELVLRRGRITVVLGPNGSGKTTLLRALSGLVRPASARVELEREGRARPLSPSDVAYAFQRPVLLRGSVRHNLELALALRSVPAAARPHRLEAVVADLGLGALLDRPGHALSGGEAQRVNLARAIALEGAVTLLDEPLSALDGTSRAHLAARLPVLLRPAIERGLVVLVTHSLEEAQRLADDLLLLVAGRVRAIGPLREVMAAPATEADARLLGLSVHRRDGESFAVPPGGWNLEREAPSAELTVTRVVELPGVTHVVGDVAGSTIDMSLPAGMRAPTVGERLGVAIAPGARVTFAGKRGSS
jgi:ABC-type nitrate/sulfonate/bicarbonate transport system ATPase subunit